MLSDNGSLSLPPLKLVINNSSSSPNVSGDGWVQETTIFLKAKIAKLYGVWYSCWFMASKSSTTLPHVPVDNVPLFKNDSWVLNKIMNMKIYT